MLDCGGSAGCQITFVERETQMLLGTAKAIVIVPSIDRRRSAAVMTIDFFLAEAQEARGIVV